MYVITYPLGRLIFNMGIAIPGKTVFLIETAPCLLLETTSELFHPIFYQLRLVINLTCVSGSKQIPVLAM